MFLNTQLLWMHGVILKHSIDPQKYAAFLFTTLTHEHSTMPTNFNPPPFYFLAKLGLID